MSPEIERFSLHPIDPTADRLHPVFSQPPCAEVLDMYVDFYSQVGRKDPWLGYFILRETVVAGTCGFAGPPSNGRIEIAYWTFPSFEGQGVATAACQLLLGIVRRTDPTLRVTAKTEPRENASTRILANLGFTRTGIVQDHAIGDAWLWERSTPA